ncbi:hypothetical protein FHG87_000324 [Trinorchestia longiramus]|nr:hypothetical protein FHG87_000324 [Trinorchestia longiramus]
MFLLQNRLLDQHLYIDCLIQRTHPTGHSEIFSLCQRSGLFFGNSIRKASMRRRLQGGCLNFRVPQYSRRNADPKSGRNADLATVRLYADDLILEFLLWAVAHVKWAKFHRLRIIAISSES